MLKQENSCFVAISLNEVVWGEKTEQIESILMVLLLKIHTFIPSSKQSLQLFTVRETISIRC